MKHKYVLREDKPFNLETVVRDEGLVFVNLYKDVELIEGESTRSSMSLTDETIYSKLGTEYLPADFPKWKLSIMKSLFSNKRCFKWLLEEDADIIKEALTSNEVKGGIPPLTSLKD